MTDPSDGRPLLAARLLGGFRITIDGVLVDTASRRRTRHVLAYLLTHRRAAVPRDVLTETFWPRATPAAARNNLHVTLSGVRQVLRAAHPLAGVERRFDTYRLTGAIDVWTDVEQFEHHRAEADQLERRGAHAAAMREREAACQLYEADFLEDDRYLDWAVPVRESLRLDMIDLQSRLIDGYLEEGTYGPATFLARRLVEADPCNEPVNRQLMACYAAAGLRHLALAQYHRLAERLWESLRVRPSSATTAYFHELRNPRHDGLTLIAS
ncbi:AfsR/SARP family transcriptional regulator [Paractinoplanes brasiliensis]|uniref:DNA-binding SARP family transcriptional activator n=1 Tax=Paractinoplanes brasiliensis TaxID=52695 RepID=A0A4R6JA73_9ACTN|nr:BTAD domain-containing putative transcriptional regulator [Actinoplanes brasiliensis]TDO31821.1 DNA-binding SARP family transcriptional activator [Actinoplanes brasiliensis]GID30581.1 hypothetical protein Abr02nite_55640 [Actinoplanes brasiliensis]